MRNIGIILLLALTLVACSSREDQDAKSKPISIDKAQIDIAKMSQFFKDAAPSSSWRCYLLAKTEPEDEAARWKRVKDMSNRAVQITDGTEILATGKIEAIITSQDKYEGLNITFPSPAVAEALEKKFGIQRPQMPPSLK